MSDSAIHSHEMVARIEPFLKEILGLAGLQLTFKALVTTGLYDRAFENPDVVVDFDGRDSELLLENKAELLRALEHLVLEAIDVPQDQRERVLFDCRDCRMMRVDELQLAAQAAADKVRRTGVPYKFNPMNPRERRVIHMALRGEQGVRTESEGVGPYRKVVIHPTQNSSAPQKTRGHHPAR